MKNWCMSPEYHDGAEDATDETGHDSRNEEDRYHVRSRLWHPEPGKRENLTPCAHADASPQNGSRADLTPLPIPILILSRLVLTVTLVMLPTFGIAERVSKLKRDAQLVQTAYQGDLGAVRSRFTKSAGLNDNNTPGPAGFTDTAGTVRYSAKELLLNRGACVKAKLTSHVTGLKITTKKDHEDIESCFKGPDTRHGDLSGPIMAEERVEIHEYSTVYPDTPEEVVEAFVKAGREYDQMGHYGYYAGSPPVSYDCLVIDTNYKLTKTERKTNRTAEVTVVYENIGALCSGSTLRITGKSDETVTYQLENNDGLWEIVSPIDPPRISIQRAIRWFEPLPDEKNGDNEDIERNAAILKLFLPK